MILINFINSTLIIYMFVNLFSIDESSYVPIQIIKVYMILLIYTLANFYTILTMDNILHLIIIIYFKLK